MSSCSPKPFDEAVLAAFPAALREVARAAIDELMPFINQSYRKSSTRIEVLGGGVFVVSRCHFAGLHDHTIVDVVSVATACLLTRSTDGYLRQRALRRIVSIQEPWNLPYVVLLLGEYVVEIAQDILINLPEFDQRLYIRFVQENRPLMRLLRARAASYWSCYYRPDYPEQRDYPALQALRELEVWARSIAQRSAIDRNQAFLFDLVVLHAAEGYATTGS